MLIAAAREVIRRAYPLYAARQKIGTRNPKIFASNHLTEPGTIGTLAARHLIAQVDAASLAT